MAISSYYGILPANVRYNEKLKPIEKLLYSEITALTGIGKYCIVEADHFLKFTGCSLQTVTAYLDNLERCGYISAELISDGQKFKVKVK